MGLMSWWMKYQARQIQKRLSELLETAELWAQSMEHIVSEHAVKQLKDWTDDLPAGDE